MQKVLLTIKGNGIEGDAEFVTEGRLFKSESGCLIEYDESPLTGVEGVTTRVLLEDDMVTLSRDGEDNSQMVFSKNSVFESSLSTPEGMRHMSILALAVESDLHEESGTVNLEYEVSVESVRTLGRLNLSFKSVGECVN